MTSRSGRRPWTAGALVFMAMRAPPVWITHSDPRAHRIVVSSCRGSSRIRRQKPRSARRRRYPSAAMQASAATMAVVGFASSVESGPLAGVLRPSMGLPGFRERVVNGSAHGVRYAIGRIGRWRRGRKRRHGHKLDRLDGLGRRPGHDRGSPCTIALRIRDRALGECDEHRTAQGPRLPSEKPREHPHCISLR